MIEINLNLFMFADLVLTEIDRKTTKLNEEESIQVGKLNSDMVYCFPMNSNLIVFFIYFVFQNALIWNALGRACLPQFC